MEGEVHRIFNIENLRANWEFVHLVEDEDTGPAAQALEICTMLRRFVESEASDIKPALEPHFDELEQLIAEQLPDKDGRIPAEKELDENRIAIAEIIDQLEDMLEFLLWRK